MRSVSFTVPGKPQGKGRPRFSSRTGRVYTPSETTDYENKVRLCWSQQTPGNALNGEIRADIRAYFHIPKSTAKYKAIKLAEEHTGCQNKPDADNIAKVILDSLEGLAFENDKAITYLTVAKLWGSRPRVEVTLTEADS